MKAIESKNRWDAWCAFPAGCDFSFEDQGGTHYLADGRVIWRKPNQTYEQALADGTKDAS